MEINIDGTRHRESLPTLVQAKQVIDQKLTDLRNEGIAALSLNTAQRTDAAKALILLPKGTTLEDAVQGYAKAVADLAGASLDVAVDFYNQHHKPTGGVKTVAMLLDEYKEAKRKSMRRERTIMDIASRVGHFSERFGERHVHIIMPHEIDQWLDESKYGSQNRINYLRVLSGFFNFAQRQHLVETNPCLAPDTAGNSQMAVLFTAQQRAVIVRQRAHILHHSWRVQIHRGFIQVAVRLHFKT